MDLKTLNRIDTLRRLRSKGPETPEWIKRYQLLISAILMTVALIVWIGMSEPNP